MSFQIHTSPVCGSLHAMAKNFRFESFEGRFFILCDDKNNFAGCRNINYFSAGKISITHTKCAYRVASATYSWIETAGFNSLCGTLHAMAKTLRLKVLTERIFYFIRWRKCLWISYPSTASGPPPFRQGRLILQYFSLYIDINSVQIRVCHYKKKSDI